MRVNKWIRIVCIYTLFLLMIACTNNSLPEKPHINGLVYATSDNNLLVIEEIDTVDIPQEQWQGHPAYSIHIQADTTILDAKGKKIDINSIHKGNHVNVWTTGVVAESYPMQVRAVKIIVLSE